MTSNTYNKYPFHTVNVQKVGTSGLHKLNYHTYILLITVAVAVTVVVVVVVVT